MYRLYHLNRFVRSFATRDDALDWRVANVPRNLFEDYEILDGSDF